MPQYRQLKRVVIHVIFDGLPFFRLIFLLVSTSYKIIIIFCIKGDVNSERVDSRVVLTETMHKEREREEGGGGGINFLPLK